jgi:hypothetical protein
MGKTLRQTDIVEVECGLQMFPLNINRPPSPSPQDGFWGPSDLNRSSSLPHQVRAAERLAGPSRRDMLSLAQSSRAWRRAAATDGSGGVPLPFVGAVVATPCQ